MRRVLAIALLCSASLALARDRARHDDPTVLTRPVVTADDACPTRSEHRDFRVERGEAEGKNEATTIQSARTVAFDRLDHKVCDGAERTPRCLAARRNIAPYGAGRFDRKRKSACASVVIEASHLNSIDADLAMLDDAVAGLAHALRQDAGNRPIAIDTPIWAASGCTAGEVGAHLVNLLEGKLVGSTLAQDGARVRMNLSVAADRVQVAPALQQGQDWAPLPGLSFPLDLFRLDPVEAGTCQDDASIGITEGHRAGSGGLEVDLGAGGEGGLLCEGEDVSPRVQLSGPARIRLYTLQADGQGFLVWPWQPEDDLIYSPERPPALPDFTAVRTWDGGDTRLLVVASPPASDPVPATICRLDVPFSTDDLPAVAALDTASFHVAAAGVRLCRSRGDAAQAARSRQQAEHVLATLPSCPSP